jgi:hypothetical protein
MKGRIKPEPANYIYFWGILCVAFFSCKTDVEETVRVPMVMTVEYQNKSGVKVSVYNSNLRQQDNLLTTVSPGNSRTERYGEKETNRPNEASPNRDGEYYLQFYFPINNEIDVPLVLPAGRGDMIDSSTTSSNYNKPVPVTIPPVRSWFGLQETLSAITNAYIIIKNEYGTAIRFRRDTTPLDREDEDKDGTKKGVTISYGESGLYKIPAGSEAGYNIHNGTDHFLLPSSVSTFSGGRLYLFKYSLSGISFVESKQFTLADLEITEP